MLQSKKRVVLAAVCIILSALQTYASTADLAGKYLEKADAAYENGEVDNAYKYVNQAMTLTKDDGIPANILYLAQTVYTKKLKTIRANKTYIELIDIQANLDQFPSVENASIKKLVAQIQAEEQQGKENEQKAMAQADREAQKKMAEDNRQGQQELINKLDTGMKDINSGLTASAAESKKTSHVMMIAIFVIAGIIAIITLLIVIIAHAGFKHQQVQQQQYVEAFKLLAQNQSQTNRLMLGGVTDLYGQKALKSAGSSRWGMDALPEPEETPEEKEEMRILAEKCEDLGTQIDQATNRKNNSKNVSELVYKLAMALGLPQHEAMVFFCAAMVYDAGFLDMDPELLSAESLTPEQREELKRHVSKGEDHLQFVPKRYWEIFDDAANKHHENMDGSGYPDGLKGDKIPQIARLIRVAESFISMSSKRNYHEISDKETAIAKLKEKPELYDPDVVAVLESII
jgi:HD-GYP domain-containing protein (c-di-GMP phosphodiesterase class II)